MPVSVHRNPFEGSPELPRKVTRRTNAPVLRVPQARVLAALRPDDPADPVVEWPVVTRAQLGIRLGYSPTNSLNRLLNTQLVQLGLIEVIVLDIEGVLENNYRITAKGIECLSHHEAGNPSVPS